VFVSFDIVFDRCLDLRNFYKISLAKYLNIYSLHTHKTWSLGYDCGNQGVIN